ncbi:MAG: AAA family ATPase [Kiloniellaceae bacterium]
MPSEAKRPTHQGADDQSAVLHLLGDPATYGAQVSAVERIDTHGAIVFLAGDRAYKIKRAVAYPYMDFATLERRHRFCLREREVNSRTAPDLYLDVVPVTESPQGLSLNGEGRPVEWVVVMRRFEQSCLMSALAEADKLTAATMTALADAIADFHATAEPRHERSAGAEAMAWVVRENGEEFLERDDLFNRADSEDLTASALAQIERLAPLLDARAEGGKVRLCHGDLHLRNVVLLDGRPLLFDAIEFNDAIACIDVLYDLAFLLMDLEHRGLRPFANLVMNRYLQMTGDIEGVASLPLFLSTRAAVRAKVAASLEAVAGEEPAKLSRRAEAAGYFQRARDYLAPAPARLTVVGGLSGTGKTTLARALAPALGRAPGALHLRSDVLRKQLAGASELERLPASAYTPQASQAVYDRMMETAAAALATGQSVILDAVFAKPEERAQAEAVAHDVEAEFTGLWLEAAPEVLTARVTRRRDDASDANAAVVEHQLTYDIGPLSWPRLEAGGSFTTLHERARALLHATA